MNTQQTNIKETNVLIDEFVGTVKPLIGKTPFDRNFHCLITAVEKIENLEDENGRIAYVTIFGNYCEILLKDSVIESEGETKLQAVYNAVVSFLNWYNENSAKKE